ncbi:ABC protein [Favolaschia claudopus]|uniref:ABC protein n=1 Tax=Favolaschia claudopus TaxID=2862362 RepID=A0AAW0BFM0_9AGAR
MNRAFSCPKCMQNFDICDSGLPPLAPAVVSSRVLDTNDPPLEPEIPTLREFISTARARSERLDIKIGFLQSALAELQEEQRILSDTISKHEGSVSALRSFPVEILSHIFSFTLPPHQYGAASAPWTISAVCSKWRAIVISEPRFWIWVRYDGNSSDYDNFDKYETQLVRSGQLPIHLEIVADESINLDLEQELVCKIFCHHAARWETASFYGPESLMSLVESWIEDDLVNLRELTVEVRWYDSNSPIRVFQNAPKLSRAHINRDRWEDPPVVKLSWSQLTKYVATTAWEDAVKAFASASNLVDCSLHLHQWGIPVAHDHIVLPCLRRLFLLGSYLLINLETPALLELYCDYQPSTLLPFTRSQTCKLQKLVLWDAGRKDSENLIRILERLPTLAYLSILSRLPIEFIDAFNSRTTTLLPSLEHFSCTLEPGLVADGDGLEDHFMQAIESRRPRDNNQGLKSVRIYTRTALSRSRVRLDALVSQGGFEYEVLPHSLVFPRQDDIPPELWMPL